ncbi:hypothetical protein D3C81_1108260 [compost metagenome]
MIFNPLAGCGLPSASTRINSKRALALASAPSASLNNGRTATSACAGHTTRLSVRVTVRPPVSYTLPETNADTVVPLPVSAGSATSWRNLPSAGSVVSITSLASRGNCTVGSPKNQPGIDSTGCCSTASARRAVKRLPSAGAPYRYAASACSLSGSPGLIVFCGLSRSSFMRSGRNSSMRRVMPCTASLLPGSVRNSTCQRPVGASTGMVCSNEK